MKAKFIGDPNEPQAQLPETFSAFGVEFPRGKFVEIKDASAARKIEGNSHFETQGSAPNTSQDLALTTDTATGDVVAKPK